MGRNYSTRSHDFPHTSHTKTKYSTVCTMLGKEEQREQYSLTRGEHHKIRPSIHPATTEITGVNQEFQESVIDTCMETQCAAEATNVKKAVERAIEIRGNLIADVPSDNETEWTEQSTTEFKSLLGSFIKANLEQNRP